MLFFLIFFLIVRCIWKVCLFGYIYIYIFILSFEIITFTNIYIFILSFEIITFTKE